MDSIYPSFSGAEVEARRYASRCLCCLLSPAAADLSNIRRGNIILSRWVVLGPAIKLACDGRGRNTCVDMEDADGSIRLAQHAGLTADAAGVRQDSVAA